MTVPRPQGVRPVRPLLVLTALGLEARAVRPVLPGALVVDVGMGPERAARGSREALSCPAGAGLQPVAVAGLCGALDPSLPPGTVVVASEVRCAGAGPVACPSAPLIARWLRSRGIEPAVGPVLSVDHVAGRAERAELQTTGAIAVDMESAWMLSGARVPDGRPPLAVLRVVVDDTEHSLISPRTPGRGFRALSALRRAAPALAEWATACAERTVLLASPRSFCAGVDRAIQIVEAALDRFGPPVYVRKQIVHNRHVVADLEARGAVFVDEPGEVPEGAHIVFSAHGVSPAVRQSAAERELLVIDATCPLVNKVHAEARRFAAEGRTIMLIGHGGHEEVEGTSGEAPASTVLVERAEDVEAIEVADPERVAYLTQTTLALDETAGIIERLHQRFPALEGPPTEDICYATQNRQDALRAIAADCDAVFVVGSSNSSNSKRLVELSERLGTPASLIDDETDLTIDWLAGRHRIGITAGASASDGLVERVILALRGLGPVDVSERRVTQESVRFAVPKEVR